MVVPLWLRIVFAGVLLASMLAAFWGRPPSRAPRPRTWRRLAGAAAAFYGAGCGALLLDEAVVSAALVGAGVETLSVAAWLGRSLDDGEDDGGGGGGDDDPDDRDRDGDGDAGHGPDGWRPSDERAFWDYVERRTRPGEPVAG